jgi:hypothetical protein
MTARSSSSAKPAAKAGWSATRTIQVLAVLCVGLALMCLGLAILWERQHQAAECWRAAAEYHLAPESCSGEPAPPT